MILRQSYHGPCTTASRIIIHDPPGAELPVTLRDDCADETIRYPDCTRVPGPPALAGVVNPGVNPAPPPTPAAYAAIIMSLGLLVDIAPVEVWLPLPTQPAEETVTGRPECESNGDEVTWAPETAKAASEIEVAPLEPIWILSLLRIDGAIAYHS